MNIALSQDAELCPPGGLDVFGGDGQNVISWSEPIGNIGCGDFSIDELPYSNIGSTTGAGDDWPVTPTSNEDVAYTLNVSQATTFDITVCSQNTDFDTKLEIFTNNEDCTNPVSTGNYNDDATCEFSTLQSSILGVTLQPGQYYVVVDGWGTSNGTYELQVSVAGARTNTNQLASNSVKEAWPIEIDKMIRAGYSQEIIESYTNIVMDPLRYAVQNSSSRDIPEECGTFTTYRLYDEEEGLIAETTELSYTHTGLENGMEYCYYVSTVYSEGVSEETDIVCGTPAPWEAAPPTNVYAEVWDEEITLYWTDPSVQNLGIPYQESFDPGGLLDLWLVDGGENWVYDEALGNPTPSYRFNWSPNVSNYSQSLYAPVLPLGELNEVTISFDLLLDNWTTLTGAEFLSAEYKSGSDANWNVLEAWDNSMADFPFTTFSYDISGVSGSLQFRFHCYGASSFDIDFWVVDNFSVTSTQGRTRNEYDFMGYNVYLDGSLNNNEPFDSTYYVVPNLDNEVQYTFGVTAAYEGSEAMGDGYYESSPVTVLAQPVYVYGDVIGTVTDPNGDALDSVVVSAGSISDTTGTDGSFVLYNLDVGLNDLQVRKSGFYTSTIGVQVLAQAAPTTQDFVMSPDMPTPVGLKATPMDEQVYLEWRSPGGMDFYDLKYYDEVLEAQIGCNSTCQFAVRFTPPNYPTTLMGLVLSFNAGNVTGGSVDIYLDPDGLVAGPVGEPINLVPSADFSAPNGLTEFQVDASVAAIEVLSGDIYVVVSENATGFMGIANDTEPQSDENFDRNWVSSAGTWSTINELVGGDPTLAGDFGILAQFLGVPGLTSAAMGSSISSEVIAEESSFGVITNTNTSVSSGLTNNLNPDNIIELTQPYIPQSSSLSPMSRDDELVEYRIYEVDNEGNETYVTSTAPSDTFVTVAASPNYLEYCYNVSAYWLTQSYGNLESRPSNVACTVPYAIGDADFDSDTDINDVLVVIDFILEEDFPTEDEFRNVDINLDEELNIADVIMMIDLIFGGTVARAVDIEQNEMAYIDLEIDYVSSNIVLNIENHNSIRGLEFELTFDSELIEVMSPKLSNAKNDAMVLANNLDDGKIKIVAADLGGGLIESKDESFLIIPMKFIGSEFDNGIVSIDEVKIAGLNGNLINYVARSTNLDIQLIPNTFALLQNFPNPFNPSTEIRFQLPDNGYVELSIYNMAGQRVKSLISNKMEPGYHSVIWDGLSDTGTLVSTGMYFYRIQSGINKATRKMLFIK